MKYSETIKNNKVEKVKKCKKKYLPNVFKGRGDKMGILLFLTHLQITARPLVCSVSINLANYF